MTEKKKPSKPVRKAKAPAPKKSSAPSRTRAAKKRGPVRPPKAPVSAAKKPRAKKPVTSAATIAPPPPVTEKRGRGRPKDTPDIWTPEHIDAVADLMFEYIEATDCPSVAGFCFAYSVRHQRLGEFPELAEMRERLQAKRAAYIELHGISLGTGEGAKGSFLQKMAANVGPFSLVDKGETTIRDASASRFANLSDEELEKLIGDEIERRAHE